MNKLFRKDPEIREIESASEPDTRGATMSVEPGDLYRATEETHFNHSFPVGSVTLICSHEGEIFGDSRLWNCAVLLGTDQVKQGFGIVHKITEVDLREFERVGNLYEMLRHEN